MRDVKLPNIFEKRADAKTVRAGETVFAAGDAADFMYVVKTGTIEIVRNGQVVDTVGPDGFFGEMALIDASPRSADARAKVDCDLVPINEKQFLFMVGETPFFALAVMRELAARLRRHVVG